LDRVFLLDSEAFINLCALVKPLPIYDSDVGRQSSQKTTKRSKCEYHYTYRKNCIQMIYCWVLDNPHEECYVTDVSHRSRRCVTFRKRRHTRAFGPVNDGMLQKVQVPVDASYNEPRAEYTLDSTHLIQADAIKNGLSRLEIPALNDSIINDSFDEHTLKIHRLTQPVADFLMNIVDGKFWTQLNCKLWNKNEESPRKDENNRHLTTPPVIVLRKNDFLYIMSLLETNCFNVSLYRLKAEYQNKNF
jgi:hypothetical protein